MHVSQNFQVNIMLHLRTFIFHKGTVIVMGFTIGIPSISQCIEDSQRPDQQLSKWGKSRGSGGHPSPVWSRANPWYGGWSKMWNYDTIL